MADQTVHPSIGLPVAWIDSVAAEFDASVWLVEAILRKLFDGSQVAQEFRYAYPNSDRPSTAWMREPLSPMTRDRAWIADGYTVERRFVITTPPEEVPRG